MKLSDKAQEWLDRYIKEASLFLPLSNRKENQKELTSDLMDQLEDLEQESIDEEIMTNFLKGLGSPYSRARQYSEERPLISSAIMPLFQLVTLIVCSVLVGVSFFGFFFQQDQGILPWISQTFSTILSLVGWMVFVFFIIDRLAPRWKWDFSQEKWDPKQLSSLKEQNPSWVESIAGWIFSMIFIYLMVVFQDKLGLWYREGDQWHFVPILARGFYKLIPFFIIGLVWDSMMTALFRIQKGWTLLTRSMDLLKSGLDMAITFYLLKSGWQFLFLEGALEGTPLETLQSLSSMGKSLFPALMILALMGLLVETIKKAIRLLKNK